MNRNLEEALTALAASKILVEDYSNRIEAACVEYYETGKTEFPNLSRAEDEDTARACMKSLEEIIAIIPDAKARWESIKYPSNEYKEMVERARDMWIRRRNLFRVFEETLKKRLAISHSSMVGGEGKTVVNNVTLNFSNGSSFTGPIAVGENIKISYDAALSASKEDLRGQLQELVALVSELTEEIDSIDDKNNVSVQLKSFVEEAKKEKPSNWMLGVSSKGLIEAANTVAAMASPISSAVKAVLALVAPGL